MTRISKRNAAKIRAGIVWGKLINEARSMDPAIRSAVNASIECWVEPGSLVERAAIRTAYPHLPCRSGCTQHRKCID